MKHKKLLLSALLSVFVFSGAFAQFNFNTNTNIGQKLSNVILTDKDTFLVHFNTALATSKWTPCKLPANIGKDSITIVKCQNQKGIQCFVYTDNTTTTAVQSTNFKGAAYGTNGNAVHVASLDSMLKVMGKSSTSTTFGYAIGDTLTMPAHCLFNTTSTSNQAFGVYPGKFKHLEYGFYFNLSGKIITDDITFDLDTYNAGTSGKTATYELTVYASTSTISTFSAIGSTTNDGTNLMIRVPNFYTTGSGPVSINLSTVTGKTANDFTNKYVYIFLKTLGTANNATTPTVDGLPNAVDRSVANAPKPVVYDPIISVDNFSVMYATPVWNVPATATANAYLNHNNGTVSVGSALDFSGGTAVSIYPATENTIKIYLTDSKRASAITITEGNDGGAPNLKYYFPATGGIKAKAGALGFITDVPYTFTPSDGTSKFVLTIPAPVAGLATDTLELSLKVNNVASAATSLERLEITNGVRFYYSIGAKADLSTAIKQQDATSANIFSNNEKIFVTNATENVIITNIAGQRVKTASASEAASGIQLASGIYLVKTGATVQKVVIK